MLDLTESLRTVLKQHKPIKGRACPSDALVDALADLLASQVVEAASRAREQALEDAAAACDRVAKEQQRMSRGDPLKEFGKAVRVLKEGSSSE